MLQVNLAAALEIYIFFLALFFGGICIREPERNNIRKPEVNYIRKPEVNYIRKPEVNNIRKPEVNCTSGIRK